MEILIGLETLEPPAGTARMVESESGSARSGGRSRGELELRGSLVVADEINTRPRNTLNWLTPAELSTVTGWPRRRSLDLNSTGSADLRGYPGRCGCIRRARVKIAPV